MQRLCPQSIWFHCFNESRNTALSCDATLALMLLDSGVATSCPVHRSVAVAFAPLFKPISSQLAVICLVPLPILSKSTTTSPLERGPAHTCNGTEESISGAGAGAEAMWGAACIDKQCTVIQSSHSHIMLKIQCKVDERTCCKTPGRV